ncbi:MAG: dihydroxyacetone kinase subunit DhaK, partial [Boseongicola sp.]|nr:dihydroxyacetone kinase subunit DhaK [Boseongicola sp.]
KDAGQHGFLAVTGEAGCLLIVKNYTGDRLNFGLAAELARALGRKVEMVVVDDDVALPELSQPRGVAGTLFVHKIAGALADAGASLDKVTQEAKRVIGNVASIGASLDTCTIPGSPKEDRIPFGKAELGLGIHGEPGIEQIGFAGAAGAMEVVLEKLRPHIDGGPCVALMNNLGSTTSLEMSVLCHALAGSGAITHMIGPAPMMTSLDMQGFSVSVLPATESDLAALSSTVPMPAWPGLTKLTDVEVTPLPDGLTPIEPIPSPNPRTRRVIEQVADLLIGAERQLNELDAKSGDGDTGSTLAAAARSLKSRLDRMPLADLTQFFPVLGNELSQTMGGSSGVILAIYFNAAGDACAGGATVEKALKEGLKRVTEVGGAQVGDRTMIDALAPALDAIGAGLAAAANAARKGADRTSSIHKAKAGRAAYVPSENLMGHNDPGAEAVALLFEGLAKAVED